MGLLEILPEACSKKDATESKRASSPRGAINCKPTGNPSDVKPQGTEMEGHAVSVNAKDITNQLT